MESVGQGSPRRVWEIGDSWEVQVLPRDNTTWETVARTVMATFGAQKADYLIGELSQILEAYQRSRGISVNLLLYRPSSPKQVNYI